MLSSSLTHSITKAYHIMPHNQTQYYHTLLISIPLKATGIDPSCTMHQLSYLAQPKQPKVYNNSPGKTTSLPIRVLPMLIRVLPTPDQIHTRIGHSHTRMLRVSLPHTRTTRAHFTFKIPSSSSIRVLPSAIRVPAISYAYCLVPYAYDQKPDFQICNGFLCYEIYPIQPSTVQFLHRNHSYFQHNSYLIRLHKI